MVGREEEGGRRTIENLIIFVVIKIILFSPFYSINVTFILANGRRIEAKGRVGETLLDVVVDNDLDLDGFGACEGTLACSTCHLVFKQTDFDQLPNKPLDEELDMLDLAYDMTET